MALIVIDSAVYSVLVDLYMIYEEVKTDYILLMWCFLNGTLLYIDFKLSLYSSACQPVVSFCLFLSTVEA